MGPQAWPPAIQVKHLSSLPCQSRSSGSHCFKLGLLCRSCLGVMLTFRRCLRHSAHFKKFREGLEPSVVTMAPAPTLCLVAFGSRVSTQRALEDETRTALSPAPTPFTDCPVASCASPPRASPLAGAGDAHQAHLISNHHPGPSPTLA